MAAKLKLALQNLWQNLRNRLSPYLLRFGGWFFQFGSRPNSKLFLNAAIFGSLLFLVSFFNFRTVPVAVFLLASLLMYLRPFLEYAYNTWWAFVVLLVGSILGINILS